MEFIEKKTSGRKKIWLSIKCVLYSLLAIFSIGYFLICLIYAGRGLSWLWIWPLFACFCGYRLVLLIRQGNGKGKVWPKWISIGYRICFFSFLSLFVFVEANVIGAMKATPPENLEYIIVLGAGIRGSNPTRPLLLRMNRAVEYLEENPDTIAVASGGQGSDEDMSEAACIRDYLVEHGISSERIILENQSTSTRENLVNSYAILGPKADETTVGILSNGFHLYRAELLAKKLGHGNVTGISTKTLLPVGLHYVVREFFAIIELQLLGV